MKEKSKTVAEAIERAEKAFPYVQGMSGSQVNELMKKRYQHMVDDIGEMPTLNDED